MAHQRLRRGRVERFGPDTLIYDDDGRPLRLTKEHFEHLVRKLAILRWVDRLPCGSFLDVGAGCDHVPALGARAARRPKRTTPTWCIR